MSATPPKRTLTVDEQFVLVPDAARDALAHRLFAVDSDAAGFLGWTVEEAEAAPDSHYTAVVSRRVADWADGTRVCFTLRRRTDERAGGHSPLVVPRRVAVWAARARFCFTIRRRRDAVAVGTVELCRDGDTAE